VLDAGFRALAEEEVRRDRSGKRGAPRALPRRGPGTGAEESPIAGALSVLAMRSVWRASWSTTVQLYD